jgi:hypothetical protein
MHLLESVRRNPGKKACKHLGARHHLSTTRFPKLNRRLLGFGASLSHWFTNFHIHQLLLLPPHSTNLSPTGSVGMQQLLHCKSHLTTVIGPMESANFMNSSRSMVNTHTHTHKTRTCSSIPTTHKEEVCSSTHKILHHSLKTKFIRTKQNCMDKKDKIGQKTFYTNFHSLASYLAPLPKTPKFLSRESIIVINLLS